MATFTPDEIDLLKNRGGNEYCKSVWLGLYEGNTPPICAGDDQSIRDLMIDKYEKKRFYLDPIETMRNGGHGARSTSSPSSDEMIIGSSANGSSVVMNGKVRPLTSLVSEPRPIKLNGSSATTTTEYCNRKRPEPTGAGNGNNNNNTGSAYAGFAVNFDKADIFSSNGYSSTQNNNLNNNFSSNLVTIANGNTTTTTSQQQQPSFANFDDNPVFVNNNNTTDDEFSIFDLKFTNSGPVLNQVPLFPKCNSNHRWSMPASVTFDSHNHTTNNHPMNNSQTNRGGGLFPPAEDKYAALKDLDNALKQNHQNGFDWNSSSGSNGSLYSSSTPTGSMYSSPSPQSSMFGSPSQGNFMNAFQPTNTTATNQEHHHTKNITSNGGNSNHSNGTFSNPFNLSNGHTTNGGLTWGSSSNSSSNHNGFSNANHHTSFSANGQSPFANPFRDQQPPPIKTQQQNGFTANFQQQQQQQAMFPAMVAASGGSPWGVNPFQPVGATAASNANSNNPFL